VGIEEEVAKKMMGLKKTERIPIEFTAERPYSCPFRHDARCSLIFEQAPPDEMVDRNFDIVAKDRKIIGYKIRCPVPEGSPDRSDAPPECPLRFGPVTIEGFK
jgi:hypothetical protein